MGNVVRAYRQGTRPGLVLREVLDEDFYRWLAREEAEDKVDMDRGASVEELLRLAYDYTTVDAFLEAFDAEANARAKRKGKKAPEDAVTLATVHRCVHPGTLVETSAGMMPIRDISSEGVIATEEGGLSYRNKVVLETRRMLTLRTKNGYEITVTRDHGMMVWDGAQYVRREAQHLMTSDFLRLRLGATVEPLAEAYLPGPPDHDIRAKTYRTPKTVDDAVAEFLGLMVADGTVYHAGFRLRKRHRDVCDRFDELARHLFGCEVKRLKSPEMYTAEVNSTFLSAWLLSIGGLAPKKKSVPACVLRSHSAVQGAFIRGLFEDGTVNMNGDGRVDHCVLATAYSDIAKTVQVMLLRHGIIATRFEATPGQWRVAVSGSYANVFRDKIGFVSSFKNDRLRAGATDRDTRNLVPVDKDWVRTNIPRGMYLCDRQNALARGHVSRAVAARWDLPGNPLAWHHDKIVSIREDVGPAVCVEVPEHGRFLQNGFDGSNSKGLEWPHVVVVGCDDGVMPHYKAGTDGMDEEHRIFYVASTRAMTSLTYVCTETGGGKRGGLSRFVRALDLWKQYVAAQLTARLARAMAGAPEPAPARPRSISLSSADARAGEDR